ncbi:MAG: hypothetical protein Q6370_001040 [Candidatus Sigynarchaeota archaeon]
MLAPRHAPRHRRIAASRFIELAIVSAMLVAPLAAQLAAILPPDRSTDPPGPPGRFPPTGPRIGTSGPARPGFIAWQGGSEPPSRSREDLSPSRWNGCKEM